MRNSINGVPIRLTEERWEHICENHQLDDLKLQVLQTISQPDHVYTSPKIIEPQFIAVKRNTELMKRGLARNLVVHYRELVEDGFVITAFSMSEKKLKKKVEKWFKVYPK